MKEELIFIEKLQIRHNSLVEYSECLNPFVANDSHKNFTGLSRKKTYSGVMTNCAKKRCKMALDLMLQRNPKKWIWNEVSETNHEFQINFITLTIPHHEKLWTQKTSYDALLKPFLSWITKTKKCTDYVWKAEKNSNDQVHFHITTNQFIHFKEIQDKWNYLLEHNGDIEIYRKNQKLWHKNGFKKRTESFENYLYQVSQNAAEKKQKKHITNQHWSLENQLAAYKKGVANNWSNPNTIDVHSVKDVADCVGYLTAYFAKDKFTEKRKELKNDLKSGKISEHNFVDEIANLDATIDLEMADFGKVWNCSETLKGRKYFSVDMEDSHFDSLERGINKGFVEKIEIDGALFFKLKNVFGHQFLTKDERKVYNNHLVLPVEKIDKSQRQNQQSNKNSGERENENVHDNLRKSTNDFVPINLFHNDSVFNLNNERIYAKFDKSEKVANPY